MLLFLIFDNENLNRKNTFFYAIKKVDAVTFYERK